MTTLTRTAGIRHYELTNHLGNVLVIVSDKKLLSANQSQKLYLPEVISYQDYYPFGMVMTDRSGSLPNVEYRYGYNGKENDNEVKGEANQQDYGFRVYDPRVGRFLSVDPLTKSYPMLTPYQFASNTPIQAIDLDGLEAGYVQYFNVVKNDKGEFVTSKINEPILQTVDGKWQGIKIENYFIHKEKLYKNQNEIKGWVDFRRMQQEKVNKQAQNVALVAGGIITVATFIPSGGQSGTLFADVLGGFAITSGAYAAGSGVAKFSLEVNNRPEIAAQIPNGLLNATVGVVIKSQFKDKEIISNIDATLSVSESILTFNFKDVNKISKGDNLKTLDNLMNILNNKDAIKHTFTIIYPNAENECDDRGN